MKFSKHAMIYISVSSLICFAKSDVLYIPFELKILPYD